MALTPSTMMKLGTQAPDFNLPDVVTGENKTLQQVSGKIGTVVMFICNHCPYVIHVQEEIARIADDFALDGIGFVGISANDVNNYPDDSPEHLKRQAEQVSFNFPYLYDESQDVAHAYDAACTPDFFVFDQDLKCVYRGRMDESTPGNGKANDGKDLRTALDALIKKQPIPEQQFPSMGCNIKWKS